MKKDEESKNIFELFGIEERGQFIKGRYGHTGFLFEDAKEFFKKSVWDEEADAEEKAAWEAISNIDDLRAFVDKYVNNYKGEHYNDYIIHDQEGKTMREKARTIIEKAYKEAGRMKEVIQLIAEETEKETFYTYEEITEAFDNYNPEEDQDEYILDIVTIALEGDL